jgi:hypothetical protein
VDEIRSWVVTDTPAVQCYGGIPQLCGWNSGNSNVNGHSLHVETVTGDPVSMCAEELVPPGRAVSADDINLKVGISKRGSKVVEKVEHPRIVRVNVGGAMVTQISV